MPSLPAGRDSQRSSAGSLWYVIPNGSAVSAGAFRMAVPGLGTGISGQRSPGGEGIQDLW